MTETEEIKDKINIVDLIGEYIELKKAGVNFRGLCPFHDEKTPSFVVSPSKQIWHCFGCSKGGDVFEFVKDYESVEFREALEILAKRSGVQLKKLSPAAIKQKDQNKVYYEINELAAKFYHRVLTDSQQASGAREYLKSRGLTNETLRDWQIGYAPEDFHIFDSFIVKKGYQKSEAFEAGLLSRKGEPAHPKSTTEGWDEGGYFDRFRGRVMFPIEDVHGRIVGFTARILKDQDGVGKYVNSPETPIYNKSQVIFGLAKAKNEIRKQAKAVVVEGNMDVVTAHQAGFLNTIATSGTAFTDDQLRNLKKFTNDLIFAFDVDEAGLNAAKRALRGAIKTGFEVQLLTIPKSAGKDPDDVIRKNPVLWKELLLKSQNFIDFYFEAIFDKIDLATNVGKKQAVSEVLPIISILPDPVDRSHFVHQLAGKLSVAEQVLYDLLNQNRTKIEAAGGEEKQKRTQHKLPKLVVLEKRFLGMLLKFHSRLKDLWKEVSVDEFTDDEIREMFSKLKPLVVESDKDLSDYTEKNPEEKNKIQLLIFGFENELEQMGEWSLEELKEKVWLDMRRENLKQQMTELTRQIEQAEQSGDQNQLSELSEKFNNLSKELSKHHAEEVY